MRLIKHNLAKKMSNRIKNLNVVKEWTVESECHRSLNDEKLKAEIKANKSTEDKVNAMVISSCVVYLFCRLPELAGFFFLLLLLSLSSQRLFFVM